MMALTDEAVKNLRGAMRGAQEERCCRQDHPSHQDPQINARTEARTRKTDCIAGVEIELKLCRARRYSGRFSRVVGWVASKVLVGWIIDWQAFVKLQK